jgi:hypothetical protein
MELIKVMSTMDFLVNLTNSLSEMVPSKLIDYSLSKRPILNISTHITGEEKKNLDAFLMRDYRNAYIVNNIERYDNKSVAKQFIDFNNSKI